MAGSITLNKASGGQLTISPEDGTSTETVTIPSVGVGKVLQVQGQQWNISGQVFTSSSTSLLATGYSVTITPKRSDSKLYVRGFVHTYSNNTTYPWNATAIARDGTIVTNVHSYYDGFVQGSAHVGNIRPIGCIVDTVSTASTTFELHLKNGSGTTTIEPSTMIIEVWEVAA